MDMEDIKRELPYWLALTHTPNKLFKKAHKQRIVDGFGKDLRPKDIIEFFGEDFEKWVKAYGFNEEEIHIIDTEMRSKIKNYTALVEQLLSAGYNIIPITSEKYSSILKSNMKDQAPLLLYTKGNVKLMQEKSVAIVGARTAKDISLKFTDDMAKVSKENYKVVVSGGAKGVDRKALESSIEIYGQSIIVLPQGIETFTSGFKKYYEPISRGDVLVVSAYESKAPWSVGLAMARNHIIYGMASEIYVAESNHTGGTWEGVKAGLKKKRTIYIRQPEPQEKNANQKLIDLGGKAVDKEGTLIKNNTAEDQTKVVDPKLEKPKPEKGKEIDMERILELLKKATTPLTSKKIIKELELDLTSGSLTSKLKKEAHPDIEINTEKKPMTFQHKSPTATKKKSDGSLPF